MSYKSNYTGEQIDKVIGDNLEVSIKDLKRELDDAKDIVVYQIPSNWSDVGKQHQITQDNFHDIFGSEDELLKNLENNHVRLKIHGTDGIGMVVIDVTTSLQVKASDETGNSMYVIDFNGNVTLDAQGDFLTVHALDVRCGIGIEKNADGTYSFIGGSFEIIQKEKSVTTEEIAELERKVDKIVYHWDSFDLSVSEGTVSQDVYDNLLKADVVTNKGAVFNGKFVEGTSIILVYQSSGEGGEGLLGYRFGFITVREDLSYTIESFDYNLPSEDLVDEKLRTKQDALVSGKNIKTINNQSILGEGNITIETETSITPDSNKPISSGAVYNAIYSVLNTEV